MARPEPLSDAELDNRLEAFPAWSTDPARRVLTRTVTLPHLPAAILVVHVAQVQNELDHHADIALGYNTVRFETTSHSEGGRLTELDFTLASRIDFLVTAHGAHPAEG